MWSTAIVCSSATLSLSASPFNPLGFTLPCPRLVVFQSLTFIVSLPSSKSFFPHFLHHSVLLPFCQISHPHTPLTLAFLCQMSFYPSQQSLSVQGPFRVHIGKDKTKAKTNTKLPGNGAGRGDSVIVILLCCVPLALILTVFLFIFAFHTSGYCEWGFEGEVEALFQPWKKKMHFVGECRGCWPTRSQCAVFLSALSSLSLGLCTV